MSSDSAVKPEVAAEEAILDDVLRAGLPLMSALAAFALVTGLAWREHLPRVVAAAVAVVLCATAWALK